MAMDRKGRSTQVVAPILTVWADTGVNDDGTPTFKDGVKLSTWPALEAYAKALNPELDLNSSQIRAVYLNIPGDTVDDETKRIAEWEKIGKQVPVEEIIEPPPADDTNAIRSKYMLLGRSMVESFSEHANVLVGKAKEDFDGSIVVIAEDIKATDQKTRGKFSEILPEPFTYPVGATTSKGELYPKALPSGTNLLADKYLLSDGKKYGSRLADCFDGVTYGRTLLECIRHLDKVIKHQDKPGENAAPTDAEYKAFQAHIGKLNAKWVDADLDDGRTADAILRRLRKRRSDAVTKFGNAHLYNLQWVRMKEAGVKVNKVSSDPEVFRTSTAPIWLRYSYIPEGETEEKDQTTKPMSIGTFCRYNVELAKKMHQPRTDFLLDLKKTIKREVDKTKERKVNFQAPSIDDVQTMVGSLDKYLKDPVNEQTFMDWLTDNEEGEVNRHLFGLFRSRVDRQYSLIKGKIAQDVAAKQRATKLQSDKEAEALSKQHEQAA